jgi:hypothetical protein
MTEIYYFGLFILYGEKLASPLPEIILNQFTSFHETGYEHHATRGYFTGVLKFYSVIGLHTKYAAIFLSNVFAH